MTLRRPALLALVGASALALLAPLPTQATGTAYVALGDSFSAGTGTRAPTDGCYRSPYGYPALIAGARGLELDYQACTGASTADVLATQVQALGADTAYVTMTIGGNDLGFTPVVTQCALPWWISDCDGAIDDARDILTSELPRRYDSVFSAVSTKAPNASVVVGGYPRLFNGQDCSWATFFSRREMRALNAATDDLDTLIRDRSAAHDFGYVDPRPSFAGHGVCDDQEWVNGFTFPFAESFHPNRAGNEAYADVFWPGAGSTGLDRLESRRRVQTPEAEALGPAASAQAVLDLDLASPANLRRARWAGVSTGQIRVAERELRSSNPDTRARGLRRLHRLDDQQPRGSAVGGGREHAGPVRG
ncbi:MAG: SGNH/GDSL hydrolase family protein [Ornithinimicrobium sp.]